MIYRKKQYLGTEEEKLSADIIYGENKRTQTEINAMLLDQIPVGTATGTTINIQDSSNLPLKNYELQGNATQDDTPTPTTPQAIHVVTGDNTIKVVGKNLFDQDNVTFTIGILDDDGEPVSSTSSKYTDQFYKVEPNKQFTIQGTLISTGSYRIYFYDINKQWISRTSSLGTIPNTITAPANCCYIRIQVTVAITLKTNDVQLEIGSTATAYEPYQEQSVTLPLGDKELAKIGDYADRIYKDNGKWYLYKAINKFIATGEESGWSLDTSYNAFFRRFTDKEQVSNSDKKVISNYFNGEYTTTSANQWTNYPNNSIGSRGGSNFIGIKATQFTTLLEFTTWLGTHNTEIRYVLATPTTTEITDTALINALEQALAMTTYKNTTNAFTITVSDNATPTLQVEYRQDLQTLTDQIATLDARVSLLE